MEIFHYFYYFLKLLRAGVAMMFNNNFQLQILKHSSDPEGRFIIADIHTGDKIMTQVNVYAPNEDRPAFFLDRNVLHKLCFSECDFLVFGGDFNSQFVMFLKTKKRVFPQHT